MQITGDILIDGAALRGNGKTLRAFNPSTGNEIAEPEFASASDDVVARACDLARAASDTYRHAPLETRARFLEAIATGIVALGDTLIERAQAESGLPKGRLEGERGRTVGQLRLFASLAREGRSLEVVSSDLRELMLICDRIGVMTAGQLAAAPLSGSLFAIDCGVQGLPAASYAG